MRERESLIPAFPPSPPPLFGRILQPSNAFVVISVLQITATVFGFSAIPDFRVAYVSGADNHCLPPPNFIAITDGGGQILDPSAPSQPRYVLLPLPLTEMLDHRLIVHAEGSLWIGGSLKPYNLPLISFPIACGSFPGSFLNGVGNFELGQGIFMSAIGSLLHKLFFLGLTGFWSVWLSFNDFPWLVSEVDWNDIFSQAKFSSCLVLYFAYNYAPVIRLLSVSDYILENKSPALYFSNCPEEGIMIGFVADLPLNIRLCKCSWLDLFVQPMFFCLFLISYPITDLLTEPRIICYLGSFLIVFISIGHLMLLTNCKLSTLWHYLSYLRFIGLIVLTVLYNMEIHVVSISKTTDYSRFTPKLDCADCACKFWNLDCPLHCDGISALGLKFGVTADTIWIYKILVLIDVGFWSVYLSVLAYSWLLSDVDWNDNFSQAQTSLCLVLLVFSLMWKHLKSPFSVTGFMLATVGSSMFAGCPLICFRVGRSSDDPRRRVVVVGRFSPLPLLRRWILRIVAPLVKLSSGWNLLDRLLYALLWVSLFFFRDGSSYGPPFKIVVVVGRLPPLPQVLQWLHRIVAPSGKPLPRSMMWPCLSGCVYSILYWCLRPLPYSSPLPFLFFPWKVCLYLTINFCDGPLVWFTCCVELMWLIFPRSPLMCPCPLNRVGSSLGRILWGAVVVRRTSPLLSPFYPDRGIVAPLDRYRYWSMVSRYKYSCSYSTLSRLLRPRPPTPHPPPSWFLLWVLALCQGFLFLFLVACFLAFLCAFLQAMGSRPSGIQQPMPKEFLDTVRYLFCILQLYVSFIIDIFVGCGIPFFLDCGSRDF